MAPELPGKAPAEPLRLFPNLPHSPVISEMWFWLECTRVRKSHIHLAHPAAKNFLFSAIPAVTPIYTGPQDLTRTQGVSYDMDKPSSRRPIMYKVCKVKQSMVLSSRTLPTAGRCSWQLWTSSSVFAAFTVLPTTHMLASIAMMLWSRHLVFLLRPYRTQFWTPAPTVMGCFLTLSLASFLSLSHLSPPPLETSQLQHLLSTSWLGGPPLKRVIQGSHLWGSTLELD